MRVTYRWLKEYVDFSESPQELAAKITMLGHEVEGVEKIGGEFTGVVTARIESVQPHPEFDDAFTAGLIEKRGRGVVPDALLAEAAARLGQRPPDSGPVADRIARFFLAANQAAAQPVK